MGRPIPSKHNPSEEVHAVYPSERSSFRILKETHFLIGSQTGTFVLQPKK